MAAVFPNLKTLCLGPEVSDAGLVHLEGLAGRLPSLSCLQLNGCEAITDRGIRLVARLA